MSTAIKIVGGSNAKVEGNTSRGYDTFLDAQNIDNLSAKNNQISANTTTQAEGMFPILERNQGLLALLIPIVATIFGSIYFRKAIKTFLKKIFSFL